MSIQARNVIQILASSIDLYFIFKAKGYDFDKKTEEELREKLSKLTLELRDIPNLPEG